MLRTIFIFNKPESYQRWNIKDNRQRYQLVRCYDVSKTLVSFRYQMKRLCNVLSRSVSLRYQLVNYYEVSNWSVLFTYHLDDAETSQIGLCCWPTSWDVVIMSQLGPRWSNQSVKWVNMFFLHLWCFSLIKILPNSSYSVSKTSVSFRY